MPHDGEMRIFAPAKINLTLHLTGKRTDGYHLLDSLVVFGSIGDYVSARSSQTGQISLLLDGPQSKGLTACADNLVMRAAEMLHVKAGISTGVVLTLEKHLPVSSGIGGGSSDAAAVLLMLNQFWQLDLPMVDLKTIGMKLGADVPVCLERRIMIMRGIGDELKNGPSLGGEVYLLLVNPGVGVPTREVFKSRSGPFSTSIPPYPDRFENIEALCAFLKLGKNDLYEAASLAVPIVIDVINALDGLDDCMFARMSGSGGTCFGLFKTRQQADMAHKKLKNNHPNWWYGVGTIIEGDINYDELENR